MRQRLDRRPRDGVEAPVVVADAPRPVRLTREHHRRRVPGRRVLDPAAVGQVDELRAQLRELTVGQPFHRTAGLGEPRPARRRISP